MRALAAVALLVVAAAANPEKDAIVTLPFGTVAGNVLERSNEFLGIPFAAPPQRFAVAEPWTARFPGGHWKAKTYSPQCLQVMMRGIKLVANFSEDCLYLNVYRPLGEPEAPWPVMLWIHGGAWETGSANLPNYNGSVLAAQEKVVLVSANYRLGFLGFMPTVDNLGNTIGNLGFLDQREAMRWVKNHIQAFGGDPARVTIFGESAGGNSVGMHYLSLGSAGLFHSAIVQSGPFNLMLPLQDALNNSRTAATRWGCAGPADLACLRRLDAAYILSQSGSRGVGDISFEPCVDGSFLTAPPLELVETGRFNKVPMLIGTNANEGNGLLYPPITPSKPTTPKEARCAFEFAFGEHASKMLDIYTVVESDEIDNRKAVSDFFSDAALHCDNRVIEQALVKAGVEPWVYLFDRQAKCVYVDQMGYLPFPGTAHGDEIVYVFNNMEWLASNPASASVKTKNTCVNAPEDLSLAAKVSQLWGTFARTGSMGKDWPRYGDAEFKVHLKLGSPEALDIVTGHRRGQCDALKRLGFTPAELSDRFTSAILDGLLICENVTKSNPNNGITARSHELVV